MADLIRYQAMGYAAPDADLAAALAADGEALRRRVDEGTLLTVGAFAHEDLVFLYAECVGAEVSPDALFSALSACMRPIPCRGREEAWKRMPLVFYHAIPRDSDDWHRPAPPEKRMGRLAIIRPEKLHSYVHYHYALTEEGLLTGDKFLCISLADGYLFAYTEEPRVMENIRRDMTEPSRVIRDWFRVDPMGHFVPWEQEPQDHFQTMETLLLLAAE